MNSLGRSNLVCSSMRANGMFYLSVGGGSGSTLWAAKINLYPEYVSVAVKTNYYSFHDESVSM